MTLAPARRETSDEAWAVVNTKDADGTSARQVLNERILDLLRRFPDGLTDDQMQRMIDPTGTSVHANRRHLVEDGLVRWSRETRRLANGRSARVWVLGQDTPEERQGGRRLPEAYLRVREAEELVGGRVDVATLQVRLPDMVASLREQMAGADDERVKQLLLLIAGLAVAAYRSYE